MDLIYRIVPGLHDSRRLKGIALFTVKGFLGLNLEACQALVIDAIILMPDTFSHSPDGWKAIRTFAAAQRIPIGGSFLYSVEQGALFGNANDLYVVGKLTAPLASKVLHGMSAGAIPVVTPEQQLIINYHVARELGIAVPEGMLNMATQIIH